jgi:hypothetical protein
MPFFIVTAVKTLSLKWKLPIEWDNDINFYILQQIIIKKRQSDSIRSFIQTYTSVTTASRHLQKYSRKKKQININNNSEDSRCLVTDGFWTCDDWPPLWSSGQSSWLQTLRSRIRFPALRDFLSSTESGTGSTQPREHKWGATWI